MEHTSLDIQAVCEFLERLVVQIRTGVLRSLWHKGKEKPTEEGYYLVQLHPGRYKHARGGGHHYLTAYWLNNEWQIIGSTGYTTIKRWIRINELTNNK